ncbi:MAG: DNA-processing protein DprA [Muribaculaceae bacterium]|nr:DNA-processing protein DprA [Muribaculaceae bacterium]
MNYREREFFIALANVKGIDFQMAKALIERYGSAEAIFSTETLSLPDEEGVEREINLFKKSSKEELLQLAEREIDFIEREDILPISFCCDNYPKRLLNCSDAPILIYSKGYTDFNSAKYVSIVGTRHATEYGRDWCEKFVHELAEMFPEVVIVSGLAYGIDICAHRAALDSGATTVAVLGNPLNNIYPSTHRHTAEKITGNGALISEYSSQSPTLKVNFVARNRIVAGMSDATVIVESKEKGGSLITAALASDYSREVFALPGNVDRETSKGCNNLIRDNKAQLITSAKDMANTLGWEPLMSSKRVQNTLFPDFDDTEQTLIDIITEKREVDINTLSMLTGIATSKLLSSLMGLEFKGAIKSYPGNRYKIR